jgi:hypothetical protein
MRRSQRPDDYLPANACTTVSPTQITTRVPDELVPKSVPMAGFEQELVKSIRSERLQYTNTLNCRTLGRAVEVLATDLYSVKHHCIHEILQNCDDNPHLYIPIKPPVG